MLDEADLERYSRQLLLPEWSGEAQERLQRASAMVVGLGALGSPVAAYLVGAGVGRVGIVDSDDVELSNLPRQPLHFTSDVSTNKALSASAKLALLNPTVLVEPYPARLGRIGSIRKEPSTTSGLRPCRQWAKCNTDNDGMNLNNGMSV